MANPSAVETFAAEMLTVRQEVVNLLMWEIGKSLDDSSKEFDRTLQYIHKTVEALKEVDGTNSRFGLDGGVIAQVRRAPLGVCLSMGPFNYPLNEMYTTLIPALIMGNTTVVKPPKFGVLLHQPLLRLCGKLPARRGQFHLWQRYQGYPGAHEKRQSGRPCRNSIRPRPCRPLLTTR